MENGTERQLRTICAEEIMRALASGAQDDEGVASWVEQVSAEIAEDILRNFEVIARENR